MVIVKNNMNKISLLLLVIALCCDFCKPCFGITFRLPANGDVVGEIQTTVVRPGESLGDIGRRFDVGVYELIEANPELDPWVPTTGATVIIPTQYVLPPGPRTGIVLNLAEMRLYYYHPDRQHVTTHPVGLGKKGWSTPLGQTVITDKRKDPAWYPPEGIRQEHLAKGDILPAVVPGGPDNPLGRYAFYLSMKGLSKKGNFLIHGTNSVGGVGVRSSHGCVRLLPADIETLFYTVPIGTSVRIMHEPYKVGWHNNRLYLESHKPLTEAQYAGSTSLSRLEKLIGQAIRNANMARYGIDWTSATWAAKTANGYPVRID